MSYNVRDENSIFGASASVEIPNGAGASTITAIQNFEPCGLYGVNATSFVSQATTAGTSYTVFIAPPAPSAATGITPLGSLYQIVGANIFYTTAASGAARMVVEVCPAGTANGSGNVAIQQSSNAYYLLNTALTTANTPNNILLASNVDNLQIAPGGRVNIYVTTVATTGIINCTVQLYIARIS